VASANLTEGKRRGPLAALGERVREREMGDEGRAHELSPRRSRDGERQLAADRAGRAPGGAGALGRGGDREPPLGERDERPATRAQNEDGPAILHDRLRWPYPRHRRQRTGSLHASTW